MIEGRVKADGTLEVGPHLARPEVLRQLLVLSIGLASLGTLAGGVLAIGELTPGRTPLFQAAQGQIGHRTDISLLAVGAAPAELAQVDGTVAVIVTEPVQALIARTPVGKVQHVATPVSTVVTPATVGAPTPASTAPAAVAQAQPTTTTTAPTSAGAAPAATAAPATTSTTVQARDYTVDEVKAIITEVFGPEHAQNAITVAHCESRLNPKAISRGGGNWGLFQINRVHKQRVANMGYAWEDLLDPRVNSIVAKSIFDGSGWSPWTCKP